MVNASRFLLLFLVFGIFLIGLGCGEGVSPLDSTLYPPSGWNDSNPYSPDLTGQSRGCDAMVAGRDIAFAKEGPSLYGEEYNSSWTNETNLTFSVMLYEVSTGLPIEGALVGIDWGDQSTGSAITLWDGTAIAPHTFPGPGEYVTHFWFDSHPDYEVSLPLVVTWRFTIDVTPPRASVIFGNDGIPPNYLLFFDKPVETSSASDPANWQINGSQGSVGSSGSFSISGSVDHVEIFNGGNSADVFFTPSAQPLDNRYSPVEIIYADSRGAAGISLPPQDPNGPGEPGSPCNCDFEVTCDPVAHSYEQHEDNAISLHWRMPPSDPCRFAYSITVYWTDIIDNADPYSPLYLNDIEDTKISNPGYGGHSYFSSRLLVPEMCETLTFSPLYRWDITLQFWGDCDNNNEWESLYSFGHVFDDIDSELPRFVDQPIVKFGPDAADWLEDKANNCTEGTPIRGPFFNQYLDHLRAYPCRLFVCASADDNKNLPEYYSPFIIEKLPLNPNLPDPSTGMGQGFLLRVDKPDPAPQEVVESPPWCCPPYFCDGDVYNELEYFVADVTDLMIGQNPGGFQVRVEDFLSSPVSGVGN